MLHDAADCDDSLTLDAQQLFLSTGAVHLSLAYGLFDSQFDLLCAIDTWGDCVMRRPYAIDPDLLPS